MKRLTAALLLCLPPLAAEAQEIRPLTAGDAAAIASFYNDPATVRLTGPARIPAGAQLEGPVGWMGGPVELAGTVRGDVLVINGDLRLRPGATVTGGVRVVGGGVTGSAEGVTGPVVVYSDPLRFRREDDRLVPLGPRQAPVSAGWTTSFGRGELMATVDGSYNRVEGLPVAFGPRVELGQSNPTVLGARLIYRTRSGLRLHHGELGHDVQVEQYLGGHQSWRVGVGHYDAVEPVQDNGISDTENSLSTFMLHRDYRDHYTRRGWRGFVAYESSTRPLELGLEFRDETHGSVPPQTPWSLLNNDDPWRPQPQMAEGDLRSVRAWVTWDSRNDREDPATGWLVRLDSEQGLEGDLRVLEAAIVLPPQTMIYPSSPVRAEFSTIRLDLRRYVRFGPRSRAAVRAVVAGSPDDGPLPPQRQKVLGGEGTLPGFDRFAFDCGARDRAPVDGYLPYYGCDRSVLFQVEGRYALLGGGGLGLGRRLGLDVDLVPSLDLVLFADAGRAWIEDESLLDRDPGPGSLRYDAGAGLRLGRLGVYLAVPLSDGGVGPNFFVRLGPRL